MVRKVLEAQAAAVMGQMLARLVLARLIQAAVAAARTAAQRDQAAAVL